MIMQAAYSVKNAFSTLGFVQNMSPVLFYELPLIPFEIKIIIIVFILQKKNQMLWTLKYSRTTKLLSSCIRVWTLAF